MQMAKIRASAELSEPRAFMHHPITRITSIFADNLTPTVKLRETVECAKRCGLIYLSYLHSESKELASVQEYIPFWNNTLDMTVPVQ